MCVCARVRVREKDRETYLATVKIRCSMGVNTKNVLVQLQIPIILLYKIYNSLSVEISYGTLI